MGFSADVSIPAITVFVQGLLSFFSPCVLPLLPLYIGYLAGEGGEEGSSSRLRVMVNTIFFVLGISFAFFLLGIGMNAVGRFFAGNQQWFVRIGGVLIILLGLYQLGIFGQNRLLEQERKLPVDLDRMAMSPVTALIMGFTFSFGWTPCVGPALSTVLLMAASADSRAVGFLLIGLYTLGFVLPFLAVGLFTTSLLAFFRKHKGVVRYSAKIGGALMLLIGVLMITGQMNRISGLLSVASGGTGGNTSAVVAESDEADDATATSDIAAAESESLENEAGTTDPNAAGSGDTEAIETEAVGNDTVGTEAIGTEASETETEEELSPAPDFELTDQYGNTHTLADYRGKVIFLNFWATWCGPCREEMPAIERLYEQYRDQEDAEVVILAVAFPGIGDELDEQGIADFLEENGYEYPVLMDASGQLMEDYWIQAYPTTYMIDRDGNLYGYVTGSMSPVVMKAIIQKTLDGER